MRSTFARSGCVCFRDYALGPRLSGPASTTEAKGYEIHIFFLWVKTADLALSRVKDACREAGTMCQTPVVPPAI